MTVERALLAIVALLALAGLAGVGLLWPRGGLPAQVNASHEGQEDTQLVDARLLTVAEIPVDDPEILLPGAREVAITARIASTGELVRFDMTDETGGTFAAGQRVRLAVTTQPDQPPVYYIADLRRDGPLMALVAVFLCAVVGFGRLQGVRALLGLAVSFVIIIGFMVPAILDGRSPVAVAVAGSLLIMVITLYLSHGASAKTSAAVVGTAASLLLTAALAALFVSAAGITGLASEDARLATLTIGGLSLRGLLLAGVIVGALGVLDDVTMSQASLVFALRRVNPAAGFAELMREALSVGRDHIAATVNTLFLAYAGASLPLLILFSTSIDPAPVIATSETVAVEVVRALVGSIGLIGAVPLTTAMAAAVALGSSEDAAPAGDLIDSHGHEHHLPDRARRASAAPRPPAAPAAAVRPETQEDWERRLRDAYGL